MHFYQLPRRCYRVEFLRTISYPIFNSLHTVLSDSSRSTSIVAASIPPVSYTHLNLGKLDRIQSDDLLDLLVRLPLFALKGAPVRQDQLNLGRFLHISGRAVSIAPFSQPDIFRISADRIFFSLIRECVFYISIHIFRGILAAHHIPVPRFAAGLVIQRIGCLLYTSRCV